MGRQIGPKFWPRPSASQHSAALQQWVPMLAGGVQRNATQAGGFDSIISALQGGNHEQYLDDHTQLAQPQALDDGNAIPGHISGSKDVSREVAAHAATNTGRRRHSEAEVAGGGEHGDGRAEAARGRRWPDVFTSWHGAAVRNRRWAACSLRSSIRTNTAAWPARCSECFSNAEVAGWLRRFLDGIGANKS